MMSTITKMMLLERKFCGVCVLRKLPYSTVPLDDNKRGWRKTLEEQGEWTSALRLFAPQKKTRSTLMKLIQAPIDFRPSAIRSWFERKKKDAEIFDQRFIKERHEVLGKDLASAHFILARGGKIRFCNEEKWYSDITQIPNTYQPSMFVEAIDLSKTNICYEGLHNLFGLKYLKWLRLNTCLHIDDWCLDYISGEFGASLEYLDLSNCDKVTERGLAALYRMQLLKFLDVSNIPSSKELELTCLLLEDICGSIKIDGVTYIT